MLTKRSLILLMSFFILMACGDRSPSVLAEVGGSGNSSGTKGSPDAPVTVVIYSDFQCPACAKVEPMVQEMMKKYGDKIYLIYRYYPLTLHRHSFTASIAAECAKRQDKFWPYHDLLFDRQYDWGQNSIAISTDDPHNKFSQYAGELGLNVAEFDQCLQSPDVRETVTLSQQEGDQFRIMSTPTIFIGDRRIVGPLSFKATYESAVLEALRKAKR